MQVFYLFACYHKLLLCILIPGKVILTLALCLNWGCTIFGPFQKDKSMFLNSIQGLEYVLVYHKAKRILKVFANSQMMIWPENTAAWIQKELSPVLHMHRLIC